MENATYALQELNSNMTMTVLPVTIFISVEMIVGLFGNVLILLVYFRRYEKSNFRIFVLNMALVDLTSCLTTLPGEVFTQLNWYKNTYGWICKVKSYFNIFTAWASASVLMLLAVDRNRKVCRPLKRQIQPPFAKKLCFAAFIVSAIISSPVVLLWGQQTYIFEKDGLNLTVSICEKTDKYADTIYPFLYIGGVYFVPIGVMVIVLMILNCTTACTLFGHKHKLSLARSTRKPSRNSQKSPTVSTSFSTFSSFSNIEEASSMTRLSECISTISGSKSEQQRNIVTNSVDIQEESIRIFEETIQERNGERTTSLQIENVDVSFESDGNTLTKSASDDSRCLGKSGMPKPDLDNIEKDKSPALNVRMKVESGYDSHLRKITETASTVNASLRSCCMSLIQTAQREDSMRRKTIIMLVLTTVFAITMTTYVVLVAMVAGTEGVLRNLNNTEKVTFFFFWRLYFINTNINPILYGFMDPRFRAGLAACVKRTHKENPDRQRAK